MLVERAKSGDKKALGEIVESYKPFVIKTAAGIFITGSDMEDLIQEGCISIINAVRLYDKNKCSNFTAYVTNAVRNNYYYAIRKAARGNYDCSLDAEAGDGIEFIDCLMDDFNIEEDYIHKEDIYALEAALKKLEQEEREFLLSLYSDCNGAMKREAEARNIKYSTIAKRKNTIINNLRSMLKY
jgi:RNA polymerase sporulation-specific sigma factor